MPSIIACWCTQCDEFQDDGRSCAVCNTPLSILPLVDTMRNLEECQVEHQENVKRVRLLRAEAAASREGLASLGFEVKEYTKSVVEYHKSTSTPLASICGIGGLDNITSATTRPVLCRRRQLKAAAAAANKTEGAGAGRPAASRATTTADHRALRRFNRWSQRIARQKHLLEKNEKKIRDQLHEADWTSRDVSDRLNMLRIRIRRIVQVFQTHFSGVAPELLEALPRRTCTDETLECIFCTENLRGETIIDLPNCNHHMFHEGCLVRWLDRHNSCPICRSKVQTAPAAELPL